MNKSLRKILALSSSALLLAGIGASATTATSSVHASSRVSRLESRRARDYRDIKLINNQLSKLTHKHVRRHAKRRVRRPRKHTVRRNSAKKLSVGEWYVKNAKRLYDKNGADTGNGMFGDGQNDAQNDDYSSASGSLTPSKVHNLTYRRGWIITYANDDNSDNTPSESNGGDSQGYARANRIYNSGVKHIKANHSRSIVFYRPNSNAWNTNNN